jgi:hypothetical protein
LVNILSKKATIGQNNDQYYPSTIILNLPDLVVMFS